MHHSIGPGGSLKYLGHTRALGQLRKLAKGVEPLGVETGMPGRVRQLIHHLMQGAELVGDGVAIAKRHPLGVFNSPGPTSRRRGFGPER